MHKTVREEVLEKAKDYRVLVSADALTTGYDLPSLDSAICASGVSTEIIQIQSLGRIGRIQEGKLKPLFINLYCTSTQEEI